jgi:Uma2 family endonuclease
LKLLMEEIMPAMPTESVRLLTVEEFVRLDDDDRKTELVRGKVVEVPFAFPFVGYVCGQIQRSIGKFVKQTDAGRLIVGSGVITEREPDTLRGADVCFYSYKRLPAGSLPRDSYLSVMPELVFEVRSPSDRRSRVFAKVTEYLMAGVTAVCVVNPENGTAMVYRDSQDPESFAADAELTLPDVLPGFRVPLRQFFE